MDIPVVGQGGVTGGLVLAFSLLSIIRVTAAPIFIGDPGEYTPAPSPREELLVLSMTSLPPNDFISPIGEPQI